MRFLDTTAAPGSCACCPAAGSAGERRRSLVSEGLPDSSGGLCASFRHTYPVGKNCPGSTKSRTDSTLRDFSPPGTSLAPTVAFASAETGSTELYGLELGLRAHPLVALRLGVKPRGGRC